jgi:hypothetical protein
MALEIALKISGIFQNVAAPRCLPPVSRKACPRTALQRKEDWSAKSTSVLSVGQDNGAAIRFKDLFDDGQAKA